MSEVDDMKKAIAELVKAQTESIRKITLATETVDRIRKEKRAESNRPK